MTYSIAQSSEFIGTNLWKWRAWIAASETDLDSVGRVVWYLHPTFEPSVIETTDRASCFDIQRRGWGGFQLRAEVFTDAEQVSLKQWLDLEFPDGGQAQPRAPDRMNAPEKRVFVSYGAEDEGVAGEVKAVLQKRGYDVLTANQVAPGMPFDAAARRMIRDSDLVLGIISSDYTSPFVIHELDSAARSDKPTIALLGNDVSSPQGLDKVLNRMTVDLKSSRFGEDAADALEKYRTTLE